MIQDLKYAVRQFARHPGFTLVAVVTLALGIGATTALFTVVNGVLIRPLPYPGPGRLMLLYAAYPARGSTRGTLSLPDFEDWSVRSRTLQDMGLYTTLPGNLVLGEQAGEGAQEIETAHVSWGLLSTLGVTPAIGRDFRREDETGDPFVVLLGHGLWMRRFGGDSSLVGRTVRLSDRSFRVIGVMPPGFGFPEPNVEAWALLASIPPDNIPMHVRGVRFMRAVGRLAPGASRAQARDELSTIAFALSRQYPDENDGLEAADVLPLRSAVVGGVATALMVLLGGVGLVLLIASVNVANLLLARGATRQRELAVRTAVGATRSRLVRQLVTESALLGLMGGTAGCILAFWGVDVMLGRSSGIIPRVGEVAPDARVLAFALAVTLFTVVLFGLLPAWAVVRADPARRLGEAGGGRGTTRMRARGVLVTAEVALAFILLIGAGLLVRSVWMLSEVNPGFQPSGALAVAVTLPSSRYPDRSAYLMKHDHLLRQFRAVPGVATAGAIRYLPMRGVGEQEAWEVVDVPSPPGAGRRTAETLQVTSDLFRALGVRLLAGRSISDEDAADAPPAIVVNETFARQAFAGGVAVGRMVHIFGVDATVIGVVGDVHQRALESAPAATVYVPLHQLPRRAMTFVLRTRGDPLALAGAVRRVVRQEDPGLAISELTPLSAVVGESIARPRFVALLLVLFAVLAMALAAVGIYGVLSIAVRERTREIGIRVALGADRRATLRLVVRQGMQPVALGLCVGLAAALGLTRLMTGLLFEIRPVDPATYGVVLALLVTVAFAACWIPGMRATRVDPMEALRRE